MLPRSSAMTQSSLTLVPEEFDSLNRSAETLTEAGNTDRFARTIGASSTQVDEFPSAVSTPWRQLEHSLSAVDAFEPPTLIIDDAAVDDDGDVVMGDVGRPVRSRSAERFPLGLSPRRRRPSSIQSCPVGTRSLKSPLKKATSFSTFTSAPDRFLPARGAGPLDTSPYRLSKSPRHLAPNERRFRHRDPLNDPFTSPLRHRARSVPSHIDAFHTGSFPRSVPRYLTDEDPAAHGTPDGRPDGPPAVWRMQGSSSPRNFSPVGIDDGTGGFVSSGTGAPMFVADFLCRSTSAGNKRRHEARVAAALDIDQAKRVIGVGREIGWDGEVSTRGMRAYEEPGWLGESEKEREMILKAQRASSPPTRSVPATPFRVLDAPLLRDDFYCTALAYSETAHAIAVGLGNRVYIWSEAAGAESPPLRHQPVANYVASLSFSSAEGGHSILAVGRQNGDVSLWSTFDDEVRFELALPHAVSCLAWRPSGARKRVDLPAIPGAPIGAEELAIGDETGTVWSSQSHSQASTARSAPPFKTIYMPINRQKHTLHHSAAVKAIAFAPWEPSLLATGGGSNDRCIHFYHAPSGSCLATINVHAQVTSVIWSRTRREIAATFGYAQPEHPYRIAVFAWPSCKQVVAIPWNSSGECGGRADSDANVECGRALWAISYPGGPNEIASAGKESRSKDGKAREGRSGTTSHLQSGSHNRTSTSEESEPSLKLTAKHGHPVPPVAVRASPDQRSSGAGAQPQARSPRGHQQNTTKGNGGATGTSGTYRGYREGGRWWSRTAEEGCIVVVSSNERVNFHEVWSGTKKSTAGRTGLLGGSKILETLQGIDDEGDELIR
ncbi:hypothetical protein KEM52_006332 [Ascosphaera acerosa]|nr:hypothetical protein KEM52_006332 [Ascosphaera acerosa]